MNGPEIRALIVEDDEDHLLVIRQMIEAVGVITVAADHASSYEEAVSHFDSGRYDIVLLDYKLGEKDGLDVLHYIRTQGITTPVIFLTNIGDTAIVVEAMKAGATDYLRKDNISTELLGASIRYALEKHQTERRYRTLVEEARDVVFSADTQGRFTYVNPVGEALTGYPEDELIGVHFTQLVHAEWKERVQSFYREQAQRREHETRLEFPISTRTGEEKWVEQVVTLIDEGNRIIGFQAMVRDITQRRQFEKALRESEERYRDLFENANDLIQSVGPDGCFLYVNRSWRDKLGYTDDEISDLQFEDILRPDQIDHCRTLFGRLQRGENINNVEVVFVTKAGEEIIVDGNLSAQVIGENLIATRGIFRDITKRKHVEDQLRSSQARLQGILDSASSAIISLDEEQRITLFNNQAERTFGYQADEILGKPLGMLIPERLREAHEAHIQKFARENVSWRGMAERSAQLIGRRKDGEEFPAEIAISKLKLGENPVFTAVLTDITERKRAEEALQEYSERLEDMVEERTRELREAQARLLAQERLQQELELATQVQASLLPRHIPSYDGFDFAAMALPARYVSGDFYDFITSDSQAVHFVLADIAGKGIPAALLTSTARALVRGETQHEASPAAILSNVNGSLYQDLSHAEMFITCFVARLDARLGTLTYANAGHTEALWWQYSEAKFSRLPATGLPLGIFDETTFIEETVVLRPGDVIVFYSDGVTEAANPKGELFGVDRLGVGLALHAQLSASDMVNSVVEAKETFRDEAPRSDDVTLIVLKALPRTVPFAYPATLDHLNDVTTLVRQTTLAYGEDFAYKMELATSEIVTNVIQHAYRSRSGEMRGQIKLLLDRVQLDLYDDGMAFSLASTPAPDLGEAQEGGYGVFIARKLTDELVYTPAKPNGNHWRLVKLTRDEPSGDASPGRNL